MNSDSYKIIISLSHHRIAFEYWQRDGENKLVPMPNISWPAPLAFYCSPTGIEIGEAAIRAVHSGTSNAFDKYFERLTNDETYEYGGQRKPLRYLLLDAAESIFSEFFKTVLFGSRGSLSDNRATMPITLLCESDIKPNERALLLELFKSSGYNRFKVVEYNTFIERYLRTSIVSDYACEDVLVAWTEGSDLTLTVFNILNSTDRRQACFPGLGIDPRLDYVKKLIWNRICGVNPWLSFSEEEETIRKAATDFLNSSTPLVNDTLILSDGMSYHYSLNRREIDNLQCDEGAAIRSKIETFLLENNLANRNKILLLLRGIAAGNIFFEQTICQGFRNTIRSDKRLRYNVMQQLIEDSNPVVVQEPDLNFSINPNVSSPISSEKDDQVNTKVVERHNPTKDDTNIKEQKRKWREISALSSGMVRDGRVNEAISILEGFKSVCVNVIGAEELIAEVESKLASLNTLESNQVRSVDSSKVKLIEREWREIRAISKGKARNSQSSEAIKLLEDFIAKIIDIPGTENIIDSVKKEISLLNPVVNSRQNNSKHYVVNRQSKGEDLLSIDKGNQLIASGKLKEARDWYRVSGNSVKAKILSDLIRSQKGVELRKSSLAECKRTRNVDQIKRIVSELQSYISLCSEVNYDSTEYKKLLSEYKKLIK